LRELVHMVNGRQREMWNHTSHVLCLVANANRDPKRSKALKPSDFNPLAQRRQKVRAAPITVLRDVFIDRKNPDIVGGNK